MATYDNTNSGALFPNEKKTNSRQPALCGNMDIDGTSHWASGWKKLSSETKKTYISLCLREKDVEEPQEIYGELHLDEERKSDKAPNFRGTITLSEEEELNIVAWVKVRAATGTNFFSIKVDKQVQESGDKIDDSDIFFGMSVQPEPEEEEDDLDVPF